MSYLQINSISDYINIIFYINNNSLSNNETLLFRGQPNINFQLIPSISRIGDHPSNIPLFNIERKLIEMAQNKLPNIFRNDLPSLELLALLQHHGIPTRLLDITENALVALYFACRSNFSYDGEVFIFKQDELSLADSPIANAIADSYRFCDTTPCSLSCFHKKIAGQSYFIEAKQESRFCSNLSLHGENWIKHFCEKPLFIYAPFHSLRQQIQQCRYILFPNRISYSRKYNQYVFESVIDPIPKYDNSIVREIIIPANLKKTLLSELELLGISKEVLFCDNTDIVCQEIVDKFKSLTNVI